MPVPIFDPQGNVRMVSDEQADAAIKAGGIRAHKMADPRGTQRWVREPDVQRAQQSGGKLLEAETAPPAATPKTLRERLFGPGGNNPLVGTGNVAGNVATHVANLVTGPAHAAFDEPQGRLETAASMLGGAPALAATRMFVKPTVDAVKTAIQQHRAGNDGLNKSPYDAQGNYQPTATSAAMDALPVVGPMARQVENEAQQKGIVPALAGLGTDMLAPEAAKELKARFAKTASGIRNAAIAPSPKNLPNDTVTPAQRFKDAKAQGVNLDLAQATDKAGPAMAKRVSQHSLTGRGAFEENKAANIEALHQHADSVLNGASPEAMSREAFGNMSKRALLDHQQLLNNWSGDILNDLSTRKGLTQPDATPVRTTAQQIIDVNQDRIEKHPELQGRGDQRAWNIVQSLAKEPQIADKTGAKLFGPDGNQVAPGTITSPDTWSDLHHMRSDLMDVTRGPDIVGDAATGWLKQLTGAVDSSMTGASSGLSGPDLADFRKANELYARMKDKYDNPSSKFTQIVRAKDGTTAAQMMSELTPEESRHVSSAAEDLQQAHDAGVGEYPDSRNLVPQLQRQTIDRLLRPQGNDMADLQNLPTRFKNIPKERLNGMLSPDQAGKVEKIARTAKAVYGDENPSGTAKNLQPVGEVSGLVSGATTGVTGLATGNLGLMLLGAAPFAEAATTKLASKALTSPAVVDSAMRTPPPPAAENPIPAAVPPATAAAAAGAASTAAAEPQDDQDEQAGMQWNAETGRYE